MDQVLLVRIDRLHPTVTLPIPCHPYTQLRRGIVQPIEGLRLIPGPTVYNVGPMKANSQLRSRS